MSDALGHRHIIDAHVHIYDTIDEIDAVERIRQESGFAAASMACCPVGCSNYSTVNVNWASLYLKALKPGQIYVFTGVDYSRPGVFQDGESLARQAREFMEAGADGFKMLEGKPDARKKVGIPLDSPFYDPFYRYLEANQIPVISHVADPEEFWDASKVSEWAKSYGWFWGDSTFLPKEELYREAEGVLRKFPGLRVIFAHFFFLSADVDRADRFLERWPNVSFDITPGMEMFHNFTKRPDEWRDFFTKWADRIIFGTDNTAGRLTESDPGGHVGYCLRKAHDMRTFLETDEAVFSGKGIKLDEPALGKIYASNFERLAGATPRLPNIPFILANCANEDIKTAFRQLP